MPKATGADSAASEDTAAEPIVSAEEVESEKAIAKLDMTNPEVHAAALLALPGSPYRFDGMKNPEDGTTVVRLPNKLDVAVGDVVNLEESDLTWLRAAGFKFSEHKTDT